MRKIKLKSYISAYVTCDICGKHIRIAGQISNGLIDYDMLNRKIDKLISDSKISESGDMILCKSCAGLDSSKRCIRDVSTNVTYLNIPEESDTDE